MSLAKKFFYRGQLGASKSLLNRALIVQSQYPELNVLGASQCEDVLALKRSLALLAYQETSEFDCGSGGTTLRFLMARTSRERGRFLLTGESRLMGRPHRGLIEALKQLGVDVQNTQEGVLVRSQGWKHPQNIISLKGDTSSQYLTALLLCCWELPWDFVVEFEPEGQVSLGYLNMTLGLLGQLGMDIQVGQSFIKVPAGQVCRQKSLTVECDMSSAFALSACAMAQGELHIENFPKASLQPDFVFLERLKSLGGNLKHSESESCLSVSMNSPSQWLSQDFDLSDTPDQFPILAVLLSRAQGRSRLSGLQTLAFKESDRLENTRHLLASLSCQAELKNKSLNIYGVDHFQQESSLRFDPDQDHRMAMAAAVAQRLGADIEILNPEVVNKSCPEFWEVLRSC